MPTTADKLDKLSAEELLDRYVDILNEQGPESPQERAFLREHATDKKLMGLLRTTRALKALYRSFDQLIEGAGAEHDTKNHTAKK